MNQMAKHDLGLTRAQGHTAARALTWSVLGLALLVSACSTRVSRPAPVEDRGTSRSAAETSAPAPAPAQPRVGYVTVQPGDTLYRIALNAGQDWRDIATWNNLPNPNAIEVGQLLRVVPPAATAAAPAPAPNGVSTAPVTSSGVTSRPLSETSPAAAPAPAPPAAPAPAPAPAAAGDEIQFVWPASGAVIANFDENTNKGVSIGGKIGDPVVAAADGRVVYAGAGLRGYGNLIILQHNNTYLTAYAHNQALLVRENQAVRQGQKIAEMGSSDTDRVKLHFEVRRQGKPVDPLSHLPKR
ncbi:MAG: peptidoglycan DD-metalloendopeptidase family protein [Hydrogenophaga sp.]|uniref:peptidoglycan DD-metalloendopeptidase family protein n=1 Tax=Hydrogenophaga sp. TaxID=1904254 RepID=UPI0016B0A648|nr:peptidoglycan DD-metalloendopeptidase family protein [Hydrogenophaga sp.]NIM43451.1 peptidoglycan DD-metalloendopeptidase family protein [Hydrogenophaga sp.]NIN28520.1 peptidoglycan DD-metalloendopeptidase family protein [Hydrogenophaga sp.]NIN32979.1 peptidoglycan DD-metalloendopeptidase family protein [Hydrogenophaga sp.]NIN57654.1 peptidoglycan DD-metalloendopeptidase family protein [Hydrogenophaga sp.]NIO53949.1 peptidoglycan DD-metalloendopeptidase family protein [Hydrogenophaga sp.]